MTARLTKDAKNWAMWAHLGGLAGYLVPTSNIVVPLVIMLIKGKENAFVEQEARESLNFQISCLIYLIVSGVLCLVLIGFVLIVALAVAQLVLCIIAGMKANEGEGYRYPFCIRFIK